MTNGKIKIKDVYDLVIPITVNIATIIEKIENIDKCIAEVKEENKDVKKTLGSKISIRAFATWLSITFGIIGTVITIVALIVLR